VLNATVNPNALISEFSLITGIQQSRWIVISAPTKFNISYNTDTTVAGIIKQQNVTYVYELMQNITANENRPIDIVGTLYQYLWILAGAIP